MRKYITQLSDAEEKEFQKWYKYASSILNWDKNPDAPEHNYDIRGFWLENKYKPVFPGQHFPDTWKTPDHPTFSNESRYYVPGMAAVRWNGDIPQYSWNDMKLRQWWAESKFKPNLISSAGAQGDYQIMPVTLQDHIRRGGKNGDLMNPEFNETVRDSLVEYLKQDPYYDQEHTDPASFAAMISGAYLMGNGAFKQKLKSLESKGYDIRNSTDWIDAFKKSEREYMKFVGLGIDGSGDLTIEDMNKKLKEPQRLVLRKGGVIMAKSGIHIKPENRGKFTRLKRRTGKSASWFKAHGTPAQKKMATFALNARKWKHENGGLIVK